MQKITGLKITGGKFKGRILHTPSTSATHPMGSREKMALFNSLTSLIGSLEDVENVLDCYCGSGALGLEALSRGAKKVVFVDNNPSALSAVKENVLALGVADQAEIIKANARNLNASSASWQKYDLILADPPYTDFPDSLSHLTDLLNDSGVLVLSHPDSVNPATICTGLALLSTKSYAAANLSFFQKA